MVVMPKYQTDFGHVSHQMGKPIDIKTMDMI